jgi:hypothetical protein
MCGRTEDKADPTVVISAGLNTFADWAQVAFLVMIRLKDHQLKEWKVEFDVGEIVQSLTVEPQRELYNGASIGAKGDPATGSIGGFMVFTRGPSATHRHCAITCHHVATTSDRKSSSFVTPLPLQAVGSTHPAATEMVSPSEQDFAETVKELSARRDIALKAIAELKTKQTKQDNFLIPVDMMRLQGNERTLVTVQEKLDVIRGQQEPFGKVIATSGFRMNRQRRKMDWALVEVHQPGRFVFNKVWHRDRIFNGKDKPETQTEAIGSGPVLSTADARLGGWVCLKGRTSYIVSGRIHMIRMKIRDWATREGDMETEELVAVHTSQGSFGVAGDSGAWVLDSSGRLVAQQIAELPIMRGNDGQITTTPW